MNEQPPRRGRKQLILMVLIAAVSLGGSYGLYHVSRDGGVWGTTNKGEFVQPPVVLADLDIRDSTGAPIAEGPNWWLWLVQDEPCDAACDATLHQLRQLHVLLHRDADRVKRALVGSQNPDRPDLRERYPPLEFLTGRVGALAPGIYIVDPLGNLVFYYPPKDSGKPVLQDLKRLLKVSQIG